MRYQFSILLTSIGLALNLTIAQAAPQQNSPDQSCILLGKTPSMMISLKNQKSSWQKSNLLNKNQLKKLSVGSIRFTSSRIMAGGSYIAFFDPPAPGAKNTILQARRPGCYTIDSINAFIKEIKKQPQVAEVAPNALLSIQTQPNDFMPYFAIGPKQWDLAAPPGGIDAQNAWTNFTQGSPNATIAVLDTGILNNTDLNGNLKAVGVYFTGNGNYGIGATPSCDSSCSGYNHGTHVSGTIAAMGQLAYGETIYGVAPSATVLPVNVFSKFTDAPSCSGSPPCLLSYVSDQVNAIYWVSGTAMPGLPLAPNTVVGINMSLGGLSACQAIQQDAFNNLFSKKMTAVVSAGNDNANAANYSPASCTGVITVAATGPSGERAWYSNWGATVEIAAPGGNDINPAIINLIYSTVENAFAYKEGTSMAAPHVAGLVALMYAIDPTLDSTRTLSIMTQPSSVTTFPDAMTVPGGTSSCADPTQSCGAGIIDAFKTATNTQTQAPALVFAPVLNFSNISFSGATVSWTAAAWAPAETTAFIYTVYVNNVAVASCTNISATSCQLTGLAANTQYDVKVSTTDFRAIHSAVTSGVSQVTTLGTPVISAPILSSAARDPMDANTAYIYFSSLGSIYPGISYSLTQAPEGVSFMLDAVNNRFVIANISIAQPFQTAILASLGGNTATSNPITVPSVL